LEVAYKLSINTDVDDLEGRYLTLYSFSGDGCAAHTIGSKR